MEVKDKVGPVGHEEPLGNDETWHPWVSLDVGVVRSAGLEHTLRLERVDLLEKTREVNHDAGTDEASG